MKYRFRLPRSGMAMCALLNGVALAVAAPVAMADTAAHPAAGALKVPNARLEQALPEMIRRAAPLAPRAASRAFKDPVTGELRDQTPEEMAAAGGFQADAVEGAALYFPDGGVLAMSDLSQLANLVAKRDASGKVRFLCLEGEEHTLDEVLKGKAGKGHRHAR